MTAQLNPYLTFPGSARDAMTFYQQVFGGDLTINTFAEYGQDGEGSDGAVLRVSSLPTRLPALIRATEDARGSLVGRAVLGLSWVWLPEPTAVQVESLRRILHPSPCVVLDRPASLDVDPWGPVDPAVVALMRRVKEHFDPAGICSPGVFAGGL